MINNTDISEAMAICLEDILDELPGPPAFEQGIRRAPKSTTMIRTMIPISLIPTDPMGVRSSFHHSPLGDQSCPTTIWTWHPPASEGEPCQQ